MNKIKFLTSFILCAMLSLCMMSCHSKQTPINRLEALAEDVQQNASEYTEEDWQSTANEIELIENEIEQFKAGKNFEIRFTELKEIGRLKGIYLAQLTKYSIKSFKNGLEDAMKEAEGIMEGFKQGFEDIED